VPGYALGLDRAFPLSERSVEATAGRVLPPAAAAVSADVAEALPASTSSASPTTADPAAADGGSARDWDWFSGAALVWLMGVGGLLTLRLATALRLQRRLARTGRPADAGLAAAVDRACSELGIGNPPVVVNTPLVASPALCGLFRPRLLFPIDLVERLSADELRWVLLHELGHVQRRDLLGQTLLQIVCAVHWYNPLVWLAARLARQDCEIACDAFVLRRARPDDGFAYGRALLSVLGAARSPSHLPASLGIVENKRLLFTRITMISDHRPQTLRRTLAGVAFLTTFAIVGYTEESKAPEAGKPSAPTNEQGKPMTREELLVRWEALNAERERWHAEAKVQLRAIGTPAGVPVAFLDVNDEPRLVIVGSNLQGARVSEIDVAGGRVITVSPRDQAQRVFELREPRDIKFPVISPQRIEQLLSTEQSGMPRSDSIPGEVMSAWPKINREGKEAILMNYLNSAIVVEIAFLPGGLSGRSSSLLARQKEERNRARLEAFLGSLTAKQREEFGRGRIGVVSLAASREEQAAQVARAADQKAKQDAVIAALTPEQRKLYDDWRAALRR
jgi:beta-lactamase regulating signal transducer with metallopeptidase domain